MQFNWNAIELFKIEKCENKTSRTIKAKTHLKCAKITET